MSGASSDGRPSISSEPSVTSSSSRTLHSQWSGTHENNGEGSSSQGTSHAGSRHTSGRGKDISDRRSHGSGSPLESESIDEQDFAHRGHRSRRSGGGFLLDSAFPSRPRNQQPSRQSAHISSEREKHSSRKGRSHDSNRHSSRMHTRSSDSISSSPLSREVYTAEHPGDTRQNASHANEPARAAMDPNQIVELALSLNESRRRNMGAGQLIAPHPVSSRRVASIAAQEGGVDRRPSGSLRQYLNEQRRVSRNISPIGGKKTYNPSEATLARAQKARASIELRLQYIRLLDYLPPLKPDAYHPGNFTVTANNVPGSPHAYLTRTPSYAGKQHDLGRKYNPLQYLRNRRNRARERKSLDHSPDDFADPLKVRDWVNRVEEESKRPGFRHEDGVFLPEFHEDHARDAVPTQTTKHRLGWNFTSEELFADVIWLEQNANKYTIEDRLGHKIFPQIQQQPQKQDFLLPRASKEYPEKRRRSWVESLPGVATDPATGDESDPTSERGRKRKLLPAFRTGSPGSKKPTSRASKVRRGSNSDSSDSEYDLLKPKSGARNIVEPTLNTGALGLHLDKLLEREAQEAHANSPTIISPDTPDKWGVGHRSYPESRSPRSSMDTTGFSDGSVRGDRRGGLKIPPTRPKASQSRNQPRSSLDYAETASPGTPLSPKRSFYDEGVPSLPTSRGDDSKKSKKSGLDVFRSDESNKGKYKDDSKHEPQSAADAKKRSNRSATDDISEGTKLGTAVKTLLSHSKNESVSSLNSPQHRKHLKDSKEPSSAVTRFFKGVKNEGSKVGEFIFKRDRPADYSDSDSIASDQGADNWNGDDASKQKSGLGRSDTVTTVGSEASKYSSRYHIELPSFRSRNDFDKASNSGPDSYVDDHVTKQARATANSRSPRFDRLAPPRMDLGSMSAKSSPGPSRHASPVPDGGQLQKIPTSSDDAGYPDLAVVSSRDTQYTDTSLSRPRFSSRHWSITDDSDANKPPGHRNRKRSATVTAAHGIVTQADIAYIRALFLCSGIKAREIARRAHEKRSPSDLPSFLTNAAKAANATLVPVAKKEEHALAARILVRNLEAQTAALQDAAQTYRDDTIKDLTSRVGELKGRVEAEILSRVRSAGDEAMRISSAIAGDAPLEVKQVGDLIDNMIRVRRRRMRWVRRVGWMLVEWMLLGVMWCAWLVVVMLRTVRSVFGGVWGFVRWLFWL